MAGRVRKYTKQERCFKCGGVNGVVERIVVQRTGRGLYERYYTLILCDKHRDELMEVIKKWLDSKQSN
jgi:hypothetical protein